MSRVERLDTTVTSVSNGFLVRDTNTDDHFVVSGVSAMFSGWEVLVFPATPEGEITDWGEVAGGRGYSFDEAVDDLERWLEGGRPNPWGFDDDADITVEAEPEQLALPAPEDELLMHTRNNMDYILRYWGDGGAEFTLEHVFGENWQDKFELLLHVTERKD